MYDNRGNMIQDLSRGLNVSYNFLDLPTLIQNSMGRIEFVYDASGNLLTKTVTYNAGPSPIPTTTDYVKGIEYVNDVMTSIYHDEGRLVQVNGTWQSEYVIKDHLGNARVTFRDNDNNGFITASEITQEANYYPFGMQMEGAWSPAAAVRIPYLYNGIEHVSDLGLDINTALFRTLDPALGRWWQIDPKAEVLMSLSPYNAMNNNPVSINDPNGDIAPVVLGAIIGAVVNVASNWKNINNFWDGLGYAAIGAAAGAISGGVSSGISTYFAAGGVGNFAAGFSAFMQGGSANLAYGAVAGGLMGAGSGFAAGVITGGGNAAMQGGNIGNGMWNGASRGTLMGAAGGFLSGGIAARLSGRDFLSGDRLVNHELLGIKSSIQAQTILDPAGKPISLGEEACNFHALKGIEDITGRRINIAELKGSMGYVSGGTNIEDVMAAAGFGKSDYIHLMQSAADPAALQATIDSKIPAIITYFKGTDKVGHAVALQRVVERFSQRTGALLGRAAYVMDPNFGVYTPFKHLDFNRISVYLMHR